MYIQEPGRRSYITVMSLSGIAAFGITLLFACIGQAQSLQCMECTNFVVNGSSILNAFEAALNTVFDIQTRECISAKPGSGIKMTTCPANPSFLDKVYKCGSYKGVVTVNMLLGRDVSVHMVERKCILVDEGLGSGCHKQTNVPALLRSVLSTFGTLEFKGQLCITSGSDKALPTSGSDKALPTSGSDKALSTSGSDKALPTSGSDKALPVPLLPILISSLIIKIFYQ